MKLSGAIRESTCQMPPNRQVDFYYRDRHEIIKKKHTPTTTENWEKKKPADKNNANKNKYNRECEGSGNAMQFYILILISNFFLFYFASCVHLQAATTTT